MVGGSSVRDSLDRGRGRAPDFVAQLRRLDHTAPATAPVGEGRPDLAPSIRAVASASERMSLQIDEIAAAQRHAHEAEQHISALVQRIAHLDDGLQAALSASSVDRKRADDLEAFGRDLMDRMQVLFAEAGDRLQTAERRADAAEADLAFVLTAIRERLPR